MKILFCMATGQNAVNINPLSEINPDKVVVAITEGMQKNGQTLVDELKNLGKSVESLSIGHENSLKALQKQFSTWLEHHIDDEIIVNITGGTKPMSLVAYQVFSEWGFRCFYCDKDSSQLIWLDDESTVSGIGSKVGLERYLRTYQYHITQKTTLAQTSKKHKEYAKVLYEELCKPGRYDNTCTFIGKIHALTQQNPLNNINFTSEEDVFLQHLEKTTELFEFKGGKIICDDDTKKMMSGGWLEIIIADALRGDQYRDIHLGVFFEKSTQRKNSSTKQELDVMAMYQDKLLIVECKAKKWETTAQASEAIYKLKALSDIGGLNTLPVFVSLRELPSGAKTRAAEQGIRIISGQADFKALAHKLRP
ncbi:Card1-like endonuclease domain-containing protein [Moraxella cuniculi]|uniref:Domain of uncharacterized function (DUF1887) n=1 Tax=Moraxella cuniculi TaxID=34061 RepID=A0A448GU41_9GAMM|nr:DUF1887 family CARF protein [Moraxella cuniculi]VEG12219.1 Domain of uncharacterised function (DUF1887) [Moraxella cuniculi]